jgi:hypothetical protein
VRMLSILPVALGAALAAGCVPMQKFSTQATEYNVQTATAQDRTLLLNIMRAAHRLPMHFTELTTLTGTGTLTFGGTLTAPVGILNGGMGTGSAAPTVTVTETPTFNVAVLETQEFYQGMLKPLTVQHAATYLDEGLPPELIFTLMFGSIEFQPLPNSETSIIENNFHPLKCENLGSCSPPPAPPPGTSPSPLMNHAPCPPDTVSEYLCFKAVLSALLDRHLTTEPTEEVTNVGPLLGSAVFSDPKWLAGFDPKTYQIATVDLKACTDRSSACPDGLDGLTPEQADTLKKKGQFFQIQKVSKDYRFCFDEEPPPKPKGAKPSPPVAVPFDAPTQIRAAILPRDLICKSRIPKPKAADKVGPAKARANADSADLTADSESPVDTGTEPSRPSRYRLTVRSPDNPAQAFSVQFQPRSTEGIIYFLGEIARCELHLDPSPPCLHTPTVHVRYRSADDAEDSLFSVCEGTDCEAEQKAGSSETAGPTTESKSAPSAERITVAWNGMPVAVTIDPTAKDRSGQVLRVLTQLVALNRSAKDYPAPAVLPVISH